MNDEPNSVDSINLNTLKGIIGEECYWIRQTITLDEAKKGIDEVEEINAMFEDFSEQTREWHLGRIKHFVNNPDMITPITIDDNCCGNVQITATIIINCYRSNQIRIINKILDTS